MTFDSAQEITQGSWENIPVKKTWYSFSIGSIKNALNILQNLFVADISITKSFNLAKFVIYLRFSGKLYFYRFFCDFKTHITQPVWTLFLFKSIWTRSQGSQGCQKIRFFFSQIKLLSFCARIAPKRHKL